MADKLITKEVVQEQGAGFMFRLSIGLNFLMFALEIAQFGFGMGLDPVTTAELSPLMGPLAVLYLGIQFGAVTFSGKISKSNAFWDVAISVVLVGYLLWAVFFGYNPQVDAVTHVYHPFVERVSFWPWFWKFPNTQIMNDFIRCFGTAMILELLMIVTFYVRYFRKRPIIVTSP